MSLCSSLPGVDAKQAAVKMATPTKEFHVLFLQSWLTAMLGIVTDCTPTYWVNYRIYTVSVYS